MINLNLPKLQKPIWAVPGELPETLNVVCVFWGNKYPTAYIDRLYAAAERHLPDGLNYQFYCITEQDIPGVICLKPRHDWPIWWNKMNMFDPSLLPPGPTLYIDLDSVIVGDLEPIVRAKAEEPLIIVENFSMNKAHCAHNSSVMLFDSSDLRIAALFEAFEADADRVMKALHGDQCAIWRILRDNVANFDNRLIVSYKYSCRGKGLPKDARAVIFHGKPDPHEVRDPWVAQNWRT